MTEMKLKLAPPWITFVNEIKALFEGDPQVRVTYDDSKKAVKIYVDGDGEKYNAIETILPEMKDLGNETLIISVIPSNHEVIFNEDFFDGCTCAEIFDAAFKGNPAYSFSKNVDKMLYNITYVVFANKVVQFFNDNLNDIYGNKSTLYQEIASDVLETEGMVFFCTDVRNDIENTKVWP